MIASALFVSDRGDYSTSRAWLMDRGSGARERSRLGILTTGENGLARASGAIRL